MIPTNKPPDNKEDLYLCDGGLTDDYLLISREACRDVGPASQVLGGIYRVATKARRRETFMRFERIAELSKVDLRQFKRHLKTLVRRGYVVNQGRQRVGEGGRRPHMPRRTTTLVLTSKAIRTMAPYMPLPRWMAGEFHRSWSVRAVCAFYTARWYLARHIEEQCSGLAEERNCEGIEAIRRFTGLSRGSIIAAHRRLLRCRIIRPAENNEFRRHCDPIGYALNDELIYPANGLPVSMEHRLAQWYG